MDPKVKYFECRSCCIQWPKVVTEENRHSCVFCPVCGQVTEEVLLNAEEQEPGENQS